MGNSYVRQSAAEIQTGNIVEADPINVEFNALQSAFDASSGHSHDGTVGEGQKISLVNSITGVLPVANGGYSGIHNITATTNPGVTNDSSQGYSIGSVWVNTTLKVHYVCVDNTLGAAVWVTSQVLDPALTSISGLTTSANQTIYTTGSDTYATTSLTAYGRSLIDDADAATARGTLGLGTIATQNSNSVTITGGAITGTSISGSTVAGTTGTFSGNVSGVAGTFSGAVSGTTGTFSGTITTGGNAVWHVGNLTPANYAPLAGATFTGGISGTTLNLSGTLTGVAGSFSGTITTGGNVVWHAGNLTPANYAPLAGATFTGPVVLNADPTVSLGAAPKQYVDAINPTFLYGLTLSNNGVNPTTHIDIASGGCGSDVNTNMVLASVLVKRIDTSWSVGSGNGGLDTGSIANGTYHIWLIRRSDTGVVDALFSLSATSPTMPANYNQKRRIGSIVRSAGAILAFTQRGDEFLWKTPIADINVTNPGTSTVNRTLTVPVGITVNALFSAWVADTSAAPGASINLLITSLDQNDTAASGTNFSLSAIVDGTSYIGASGSFNVRTSSSGTIRTNQSVSTASTVLRIVTFGYIDTRGK